ncbi:YgaP family membrane protein [Neobacillus sp. LXY-4]|uniref:YgaP family membrane protein n=1 Tax=Neobacillus sp. LXY-4 TaxID=3379826 RepID=UPI003EE2F43A
MKANIGGTDRVIRLILGVLLLGLFLLDGNVKYFGLVGIVLIFTATIRFCPLYPIFKINTNKK